uniref:Uncharacterized protein n=1 Tax=Sipha flava TaxID=143950 RepID=A0A2S2QE41_9HEMI
MQNMLHLNILCNIVQHPGIIACPADISSATCAGNLIPKLRPVTLSYRFFSSFLISFCTFLQQLRETLRVRLNSDEDNGTNSYVICTCIPYYYIIGRVLRVCNTLRLYDLKIF